MIFKLMCQFDNIIINIFMSNYINSLKIMCSFDVENIENLKQLVKKIVLNASYFYIVQN
jgi:hypothetical protein